jgi:hypothetical protein
VAGEIIGRIQGTEVRGGNTVVTVFSYQCLSHPSGTFFSFRRTKAQVASGPPVSGANQLSDRIEAVLNLDAVTDVYYFQDTTPSGLLRDMMRTYYQSADGRVEGDVESDLAHFGPNYTGAQINDEIAAAEAQIG